MVSGRLSVGMSLPDVDTKNGKTTEPFLLNVVHNLHWH